MADGTFNIVPGPSRAEPAAGYRVYWRFGPPARRWERIPRAFNWSPMFEGEALLVRRCGAGERADFYGVEREG